MHRQTFETLAVMASLIAAFALSRFSDDAWSLDQLLVNWLSP
jgi:hypothetical protein